MAVIFLVSSTPSNQLPNFGAWDVWIKKGSHLLGYGLLGQAYRYALGRKNLYASRKAVALAVMYAASDEIHQSFVSGRNASILDLGIDTTGASLSLLGTYIYYQIRRATQ